MSGYKRHLVNQHYMCDVKMMFKEAIKRKQCPFCQFGGTSGHMARHIGGVHNKVFQIHEKAIKGSYNKKRVTKNGQEVVTEREDVNN